MIGDVSVKLDYVLASSAVSSWWWLPHFDHTIHIILALGGVALLAIRLLSAWKEYKQKKSDSETK
jgi:hypothetical protein